MSSVASWLIAASLVVGAEDAAELPATPAQVQQYLTGYWQFELHEEDLQAEIVGKLWETKARQNNDQVTPPTDEEVQAALAEELPKLRKLRQGYLSEEIFYISSDGKRFRLKPHREGGVMVTGLNFVRSFTKSDGYTYLTVQSDGSRAWEYALYRGSIHTDLGDDDKADTTDPRQYRLLDSDHFEIVTINQQVAQPTFIHTYRRIAPPGWARPAVARLEAAEAIKQQLAGHWEVEPREEDLREEIVWQAWRNKNYEEYTDDKGVSRYRKKDWSATGGKPVAPTDEEIAALMEKKLQDALEVREVMAETEHFYFDSVGTLLNIWTNFLTDVKFEPEPYRVVTEREEFDPVEMDKLYLFRPKEDEELRAEIRVLGPDRLQLRTFSEPELGLPSKVITYRRTAGLPEWVLE